MFKFRKPHPDKEIQEIQRQIEDSILTLDKNGNLVLNKDIYCDSIHVNGESLYIGGVKVLKPKASEDGNVMRFDNKGNKIKYATTSEILSSHASSHESGGGDEVDHDKLKNFVANEHIDWTNSTEDLKAGTAKIGDVAGGDYSEIEADGTYVAHGDARVYDDQQVQIGEIAGNGWFGSQWSDIIEYRSGIALRVANSTSNNYKFKFNCQISHKYAEGEDIHFHIHIGNNSTISGNVVLKFTFEWANVDGVYGTPITLTQTYSVTGTDALHQVFDFSTALTGTGKKISSILLCKVERDAGNAADTFTEDLYVTGVDFHVPLARIGSREEWTA